MLACTPWPSKIVATALLVILNYNQMEAVLPCREWMHLQWQDDCSLCEANIDPQVYIQVYCQQHSEKGFNWQSLRCMWKHIIVSNMTCSSSWFPFVFIPIHGNKSGSTSPQTVNVTDSVQFPRHCERAGAVSAKVQDWPFLLPLFFFAQSCNTKRQLLLSTVWTVKPLKHQGQRGGCDLYVKSPVKRFTTVVRATMCTFPLTLKKLS